MTTIAFLVLPTLNIPPLSPLPLPLPLHLPYLLLSPHSRSLCDIVHDGLPDQPAVLSPVCWLSRGRSCQNLYPLFGGEMEPCVCTCLDLSSLPPPPPTPIHPYIDGLLLILGLRPIQKAVFFKQAYMGQERIRTGD